MTIAAKMPEGEWQHWQHIYNPTAEIMEMMFQKWPHYVVYVDGKIIHVPPDTFFTDTPKGKTDCIWMVPGTF